MSLRELINKNPKAGTAVGLGIFAAAVGLAVWFLMADNRPAASAVQLQEWFTTDDGATFFADDIRKPSPFTTADGKTAVKAYVFRCPHGKTFVAYMERTNPDYGKRAANAKPDSMAAKDPYANYAALSQVAIQVKSPKSPNWVSLNDPAASKVVTPVCPEGGTNQLDPVPAGSTDGRH